MKIKQLLKFSNRNGFSVLLFIAKRHLIFQKAGLPL